MTNPRLITIPLSHYCEKARWALERAGIPYSEERHLQVFHFPHAYRAGRSDSVPVLVTRDGVLTDSTDILHWVDAQASDDLKLYPADPQLRKQVEEWEEKLDEEFGVAGRLWMYTYTLHDLPLVMRYSAKHGVPGYELRLMPWVFPLAKRLILKMAGVTPNGRDESRRRVEAVFEKVARQLSDGRPFLLGDRFTAADLTFAALSAAVLAPEDYGVELPKLEELPSGMREQVEAWRRHPAGQFALRIYRKQR
jgi:glutathione S-transferase